MGADLQEELSEIFSLEASEKIADKVCKKLMSMQKIPKFPTGSVPIADAAKIYGRDQDWVRAGIVQGWLPIGIATRAGEKITKLSQMNSAYGRINYYISPKRLWEDTGILWQKSN